MGVFTVTIQAGDPEGRRFVSVEALVDTGASYTTLPAQLLRDLGVQPIRRQRFIFANGQETTKELGQTRVRIDGQEFLTFVVFADENMPSLLGAVTLEEAGLGVDPVGRKLIEVPGYLM